MRAVPGLGTDFAVSPFLLLPLSAFFSFFFSFSFSIALVAIFIVGGETKEGFRGPKTKLGGHGMVWVEFLLGVR